MPLSPQQRAAIEREGARVCVVAGPGSGKTRVLIERFAWLVENRGVDPQRILALTFTEKAANEMKRRLGQRFDSRPHLREKIESCWVSTIDAFCARLLGENAIAAGLPPDFAVLDAPQAERMLRETAHEILDQLYSTSPADMHRLLEALDGDLAQILVELYEALRLSGQRPQVPEPAPDSFPSARELARTILQENPRGGDSAALVDWSSRLLALPETISHQHLELAANFNVNLTRISPKNSGAYKAALKLKKEIVPLLEAQCVNHWHAGVAPILVDALARIDARFKENKGRQDAVDFAGLEEKTIELLENDSALRLRILSRFEHVLMDELQDTNRLQWRLIKLLCGNLFAVGDINQSIYGFRYADRDIFEEYRQSAEVEELNENYRSRKQILEAVASVLRDEPEVEPRAFEARREFAPAQEPVVERMVASGPHAPEAEAGLVAARIRNWVDSKERRYKDIAILVRTLGSTAPFEQALARYGIPFLVSGGRTFLEARETRDLMALLAALANPLDEIALVTVLRSPLVGEAWTGERLLRESHQGWQMEFERSFGRIRKLAGHIPPDRLIAEALEERGYFAALGERERANVDKLLGWLRREHRARPRPLVELLEDLEALRKSAAEAEAPPPAAADAVRIMTIHAAKGLEFPVVFLGAMHRKPDQRRPPILIAPDGSLGIKWRNPIGGETVASPLYRELDELRRGREEAEESRLLYVGMTRAEDRLILSYSERKQPSRWVRLAERLPAKYENWPYDPLASAGGSAAAPEPQPSASGYVKPVAAGQYDSSVSVTSVALFHACPRKYYFERFLGLNRDTPGAGAIAFGLEVHRALAGGPSSPEAGEIAARFYETNLGRRAARAVRIQREFDFITPLADDVLLTGQIDLWFEEAGELLVVDYKIGRDESAGANYQLQLRLYALALERYAGRLPDHALLYYANSGETVEVSLSPEELESARAAIRSLANGQDSLEFPIHPGEQCRHCAFLGNPCQAGEPELSVTGLGGHFSLQRSP